MVDQTTENKEVPSETKDIKDVIAAEDNKTDKQQNANPDREKPELDNDIQTKLSEITNEEGAPKYSSVPDALNALKSSQEHIKKLERENAEYRNSLQEAKNMEDLLNAINSENNNSESKEENKTPDLSVNDDRLKSIALQVLEEREAAGRALENKLRVSDRLKEKYGDKATDMYLQKAKDLGLSADELSQLAAKSPAAVIAYFETAKSDDKHIQSTVNTDSMEKWSMSKHQSSGKKNDLMFGANPQDISNAWNACKQSVLEQYN